MTIDASLIERAAPAGSMRYYTWLFTPAPQRDVLIALYLLERELQDSANAAHEVAHVRLQWWRDEIDRLIAGKAEHPATLVLQQHRNTSTDFSMLHQLHLSTAQQLANATMDNDAELATYLQHRAGALGQLTATLLNAAATETVTDAARQLGSFIHQVELYRDLRHDFHHGRLYLPLSTLDKLGVEYESLQKVDWPPTFIQWLQARMQATLDHYHTLQSSLLNTERQALRPLLVLAALHASLLQALLTDPATLTRQRLELPPFKKLWTAWRTARRCG